MTILTERDLRSLVPLDRDAVDTVENAFRQLASGEVVMPPILRLDIKAARGEVDVKTAYVPGLDGFAIKISPGFFDNPKLGLPSVNGLMVYLSARTGLVEALLLDNGYLTDVRTAAAGAVAARHLSREDSSVAAILGAGVQAELQLRALTLVRPIREARVWARRPDAAKALGVRASGSLGIPVNAVDGAADAVRGADIVVTTTPTDAPILERAWLASGQHVTAMGSDAEHKNEIDPAAVAAGIYVADSLAQTRRLGELHHAIAAGTVPADRGFAELGAVIAATAPGRRSPSDLTLCDLTGTGAQDTAIATLAVRRARAANAGTAFET
jgi:ornithine cyclodeaminase